MSENPTSLVCSSGVQEGLVQVAKFNSTDEMHVYLIRALLANLLDSQISCAVTFFDLQLSVLL